MEPATSADRPDAGTNSSSAHTRASGPRPRRYGPRTCRICLDTEQPQFPENTSSASRLFSSSRPTYESDDPELGRLLSPCKCKGSQKYVHEGCLNSWRLANPTEKRNYWQCPTCGFKYKTARLSWASMLTSELSQALLTVIVFMISIFILGFLADPVVGMWLDPVGTIADTVSTVATHSEDTKFADLEEDATWSDHFLKGFFSLGLIGLIKSGGRRQGGNGRARVENIHIFFVLLGVITALVGIWKAVKRMSQSFLKNVSERVLDIGEDIGDDDEE